MDAKEAVKAAKTYLLELLADEQPTNVGLEELERNEEKGVWLVTIGFSRPWNSVRNALTSLAGDAAPKRTYRVLMVKEENGEVTSMKRREGVD